MTTTRVGTERVDRLTVDIRPMPASTLSLFDNSVKEESRVDLQGVIYREDEIDLIQNYPHCRVISFERDPSRSKQVAALMAQRRSLKARKRTRARELFSRVHYEFYLKKHTVIKNRRKFNGYYKTWTLPIYRWIQTGHWETVTYAKYAEYMLQEVERKNKSTKSVKFWRRRLFYYTVENPRLGNSTYPRQWYKIDGGYWLTVDPGGHVRYKKRWKTVPVIIRDWPSIRAEWLAYRARALEELNVFNRLLATIETKLSDLSSHTAKPNACESVFHGGDALSSQGYQAPRLPNAVSEGGELASYNTGDARCYLLDTERTRPIVGFGVVPEYNYTKDVFWGRGENPVAFKNQNLTFTVMDRQAADYYELPEAEVLARISALESQTQVPHINAGTQYQFKGLCELQDDFLYSNLETGISPLLIVSEQGSGITVFYDSMGQPHASSMYAEYLREGARLHTSRDDIRFRPDDRAPELPCSIETEDLTQDLSNLESEALLALLNLDVVGVHDAFNLTRSIGELKDTPETLRSGADFLRWTRDIATAKKGQQYYVISEVGRSTKQYALSTRGIDPKRYSWSAKRVTRKTGLSVLAALYLANKFAVQPTINDANYIVRHGWDYALQIRKSLSLMMQRVRTSSPFMVVKAVRNFSNLPFKGRLGKRAELPYNKTMKETFNGPYGGGYLSVQFKTDRWIQAFALGTREAIDTLSVGLPWFTTEENFPVWLSEPCPDGLRFIIQDPRLVPGLPVRSINGARLTWNQYCDVIHEYNMRVHGAALRSEMLRKGYSPHGPRLFQRLRCVAFARYHRETLKRAVNTKDWRNWFETSQLANTIWELSPLSFVVDWFANTRQFVQSVQNAVASWMSKITPASRPWLSIKNTLWVAAPTYDIETVCTINRQGEAREQLGLTWSSFSNIRPNRRFIICKRLTLCESLILTFKTNATSVYDRVVKSDCKRFQRKPAKESSIRLPKLRCQVDLNIGKLSSLLAMFISK